MRFCGVLGNRQRLITFRHIGQVQRNIFQRVADSIAAVFDGNVVYRKLGILRIDALGHAGSGLGIGTVVSKNAF